MINVSLAVGAVLVYLVAMEVVLRLTAEDATPAPSGPYADLFRRSADPELRFELAPGANGLVNEAGYLGPLRPEAKPAGVLRILGLGDSITMYQVAEGTNYLQRVEAALGAQAPPAVEVLNFAVGGYDTRQEVRLLETRGLRYAPDLVVVGVCLNDVVDAQLVVNETTGRIGIVDGEELPAAAAAAGEGGGLATARFVGERVRALTADMTREAFGEWLLTSPGWAETRAALDRLGRLSRAHGFDVVVLVFPFLVDFDDYLFAPLHDALARESSARGFGHVDLLEAYRRVGHPALRGGPGGSSGAGDYVHPNARGHALAAEALLAWLRTWPPRQR